MNTSDKKVIVSLYLLGDELDPVLISEELGVTPSETRRKGEKRASSTGREYTNRTGLWSLVIDRDQAEVAGVTAILLAELEPCKKNLSTLPGVNDAYFDVFVAGLADDGGEGTCEFAIKSDQLALLALFGLPIRFTVSLGRD